MNWYGWGHERISVSVDGLSACATWHLSGYGGSTSRECQWPETANDLDSEDKIDRLEKIIDKAVKKIIKGTKAKARSKQLVL